MTTGLWGAAITEEPGVVTPPADLDKYMVVIGPTSSGTLGLRGPYASARAIVTGVGYGDAVDIASHVAEQRQTNNTNPAGVPVAILKVAADTPGSYGTIDITGVTGTCDPVVDSGAPYGTYKLSVQIANGGTVGTDGITYRTSSAEEPVWAEIAPKRLGTATTISVSETGGGFLLEPAAASLAALYSKVTLLQTTLTGTGHFTITSGGTPVHAAADTARDTALAAVPAATTKPTAITLFNAIKTYLTAHGADAVVHSGADTALATAMAAIPTATNIADVDLYLDDMIAAYNAHRINVTGVHGSADSTNTITAWTPTPGMLVAGDTWFVRTLGPSPSAATLDAAYETLKNETKTFRLVAHSWPMTASMSAHVSLGLDTLEGRNKFATALVYTRLPDWETSETEESWSDSVSEEFEPGEVDDSRICALASYAHETDARTLETRLRAGFAQFCADVVRVPMNVPPGCPDDQAVSGVVVWDDGTQVGHDEGSRGTVTGLSNAGLGNRFVSAMSSEDPLRGDVIHWTVPWVLAGASDDIKTLMMRRIAQSMKAVALSATIDTGGMRLNYTATSATTGTLSPASRSMLHGVIFDALSERFKPFIQNADDADEENGLVVIDEGVTIAPGKLITATYSLNVRYQGILVQITGTLRVKE